MAETLTLNNILSQRPKWVLEVMTWDLKGEEDNWYGDEKREEFNKLC